MTVRFILISAGNPKKRNLIVRRIAQHPRVTMGKARMCVDRTPSVILEEVEAVCTRTIIIARGKILVDSTPKELKKEHNCSLDEVFRKITSTKAHAKAS